MIEITNEDNMELMARYEDNYFDLAIVDPPYGILNKSHGGGKGKRRNEYGLLKKGKKKGWDNEIPNKEYFEELKRVSKNQIIWGGNYFLDYLGSTKCFLIWDKVQEFSGADFEMAWTSFDKSSKSFRKSRVEFHTESKKIHPTQKAVSLYKWILEHYAKEGDKILDTHLGSGSIALACHNRKFDLVACELDKDYYNAAIKRLTQHQQQLTIF
jgi:site-specific DNA-methyltransferase (adenine-specific)